MKNLKTSFIAWSFGTAVASFVALKFFLPYDRFLDLALAVAFGVAFAATIRYARDAIKAFRSGKSGAEFLIVALLAIFTILLSQRVWGLVLRVLDRPEWLVNSFIAIAIPWMLSWAMFLALIAPDIDLEPEKARSGIWRSVALFIGGALAGFIIAASFGVRGGLEIPDEIVPLRLLNRPLCSPKEPVWVSSKGVYHMPDSPYRSSLVPSKCFATEDDATAAGYRKVKLSGPQ